MLNNYINMIKNDKKLKIIFTIAIVFTVMFITYSFGYGIGKFFFT